MPNWCGNVLSVYFPGDDGVPGERLRELREFVATDVEPFSLGRIIPVPSEVEMSEVPMAGYNWRVNNWGTKWDAHDVVVDETSDRGVDFRFDTAWAPPVEAVRELSRLFPDAVIGLAYDEPGMDFGGYEIYRGGALVDMQEGGSRSSTWAEQMEWSGEWE
jgi:hypothetical protein